MTNQQTLTRAEAIALIENCGTDAELRALADHWRYDFHDDSDWDGLAEGCTVMTDFVDGSLSDREAYIRGPKDDDSTELTAPPDLSKLDSITPDQLAEAFSAKLRAELPSVAMSEILKRNAAEQNTEVCHSHDFIDANEVMQEAFEDLLGFKHGELPVGSAMPDKMCNLWNDAWTLAKANNFGANEDVHGPRIGAIQQAIADGYTHVTTYGGDVLLTLWTRRDELGMTYEGGALYSPPRPANSFELELLELNSGKAVIAAQVRERFGCVTKLVQS